jgi:hypothetical protein
LSSDLSARFILTSAATLCDALLGLVEELSPVGGEADSTVVEREGVVKGNVRLVEALYDLCELVEGLFKSGGGGWGGGLLRGLRGL